MQPHPVQQPPEETKAPARRGADPTKPLSSRELLPGGRLHIEHAGQIYCLRVTKAGRLLLTK